MKVYFYSHTLQNLEKDFQDFFKSKHLVGDRIAHLHEMQSIVDHYYRIIIEQTSDYEITKDTLNEGYFLCYLSEVLVACYNSLSHTGCFSEEKNEMLREKVRKLLDKISNQSVIQEFFLDVEWVFSDDFKKIKDKITADVTDEEIRCICKPHKPQKKNKSTREFLSILVRYMETKKDYDTDYVDFSNGEETYRASSEGMYNEEFRVLKALYGKLPDIYYPQDVPACSTILSQINIPDNMPFGSVWDDIIYESYYKYTSEQEAKEVANFHNTSTYKMFFNAFFYPEPFNVWQLRTLMRLKFPAYMMNGDKYISYKDLLLEFVELYQIELKDYKQKEMFSKLTKYLLLDLVGKIENTDFDEITDKLLEPKIIDALLYITLETELSKKYGSEHPEPFSSGKYTENLYKLCGEYIDIPDAFDNLNPAKINGYILKIIRYTQKGNDGLVMIINLLEEFISRKFDIETNNKNIQNKEFNRQECERLKNFNKTIKLQYKNQKIDACFSRIALCKFDNKNNIDHVGRQEQQLHTLPLVNVRHSNIHLLGLNRDVEALSKESEKSYKDLLDLLKYYCECEDLHKPKELLRDVETMYEKLENLTKGEHNKGTKIVVDDYAKAGLKENLIKLLNQMFHIDDNERLLRDNRFELIIYFLYLFINLPEKSTDVES